MIKRGVEWTHPPIVIPSPSVYWHQYSFLLTYTLQSCVESDMSIDMVNDVLDTMTVDTMDDGLFPFLDNIVSEKTRAVDSLSGPLK